MNEVVYQNKNKRSPFLACSVALILVLIFLTTIGALAFAFNIVVAGSNKVSSEERPVSSFNAISLSTTGNLFIEQGNTESLRIEGEDNIIRSIETVVLGNRLVIRQKPEKLLKILWPRKQINYFVKVKSLSEISVSGSGRISSSNFRAESLSINITNKGRVNMDLQVQSLEASVTGSGEMTLTGNANSQKISVSDSGIYNGYNISSETVNIAVNDLGNTKINVSKELQVSISDSGVVEYKGNPNITRQSINDRGYLRKVN